MSTITLGGVTYIQESVADETIPAHNYDDMIDVGSNEDLDAWIARISAEWDNIPPEIREKIVSGVEKEIGNMSGGDEFFDGDVVGESNVLNEGLTGDDYIKVLFEKAAKIHTPVGRYVDYADFIKERDEYSIVYLTMDEFQMVNAHGLVEEVPVQDIPDMIGVWLSKKGYSEYVKHADNQPVAPVVDVLDEAQKDMEGNEMYDFAEGRKHARSMPNESLEYVRQDLINVITVQEQSHRQGHHTPKLGYYWDEYWTLMDEIARRMKQGQHFDLKPWSLQGNAVDDKLNQLGQ